jgi:para-nitrobenzyl esterase
MAGSNSHDLMPPILYSMGKNWCKAQEKPSYCWYFDRKLPGDKNGAWHSADLWYWFGTLENCWRPMEPKDFALSEQMTDYLTNFCKTGDPNGLDSHGNQLPQWPKLTEEAPVRMEFADTAKPVEWPKTALEALLLKK